MAKKDFTSANILLVNPCSSPNVPRNALDAISASTHSFPHDMSMSPTTTTIQGGASAGKFQRRRASPGQTSLSHCQLHFSSLFTAPLRGRLRDKFQHLPAPSVQQSRYSRAVSTQANYTTMQGSKKTPKSSGIPAWQVRPKIRLLSKQVRLPANQCHSHDLETGCPKLVIVKFLGVQIFKGDHNILRFQP